LPAAGRGYEEGRRRVQPHATHADREEALRVVAREESLRALGVFPGERAVRLVEHDPPRLATPRAPRPPPAPVRSSARAASPPPPARSATSGPGPPPPAPTTWCWVTSV